MSIDQTRIELVRAALTYQLSELGPEGPYAADDACLRADLLALAAREHVKAVEAGSTADQPVGWAPGR